MHDPDTRRSRPRATFALATLVLGAALFALGCHGSCKRHPGKHSCGQQHGFVAPEGAIQIVTTQIGGKNVFVPSTIVVTSGEPRTLSIFNTTEVPHGFRIPALEIAELLPPQQEFEIELPALEGHQVLRIDCHLHTPHRSATLVVLPARAR